MSVTPAPVATFPTMSTEFTLMSIREAGRRLGVHENTVRRYADRGLIGVVRLPSGVRRIRREDVEALAVPSGGYASPAGAPKWEPERSLEQLAADQGIEGAPSLYDLVAPEIWESDEEVDEFLALTYAERDSGR